MKKKSRFLICIALCLLAVSCSNLLNRGNDDTSADNKESDTAKKSYIFKGSLNLSGAIPEFLNFEKDSSLSKSAVPNISGTDWNSYYWQIDAVSGGVTKSINSKTNSNYFTSSSNPSVVEFIFDSLDEGTWDFTASLKKLASATPASNDSTIMKDTYPNITIGDALPIVTHSFILKPSQTANTGKGSIELPMTIPSSIKKITATSTTDGWSDITLNPTTTSVTLSVSNIQSKTYEVTFSFFNANNILLYTTIQTINVFDNMKTNTWLSDGTSIFNTSNTPVTFELTETIMNQFARTSIYVGVPAGLTEVTASDITGTGSPFAPVESVTKAAQIIANTGSSTCDFRIFICGEITGAQEVKNITSEMANSITITGYSGNTNNRLKGGSSGSVLYLDTDVSVTIKNLTITGGKGTTVDSKVYGGGIYINKGSVELTSGVVVNGNTADIGGGICLNTGALYINDTAVVGKADATECAKNEEGKYGNMATVSGGGIAVLTGTLWLGYSPGSTPADVETRGGVFYNLVENSSACHGAGIDNNNGTINIRHGKVSYNYACGTGSGNNDVGSGGGISTAYTFNLSGDAEISNNKAACGGGVYITKDSSTGSFSMSGGTITGNNAEKQHTKFGDGGGVAIGEDCTFNMSGGSVELNTADQNGGAIFQGATFNVSEAASLPYGGAERNNDVYLDSDKYITIAANNLSKDIVATVTPNSWTRGKQVLYAGTDSWITDNYSRFNVSDEEWKVGYYVSGTATADDAKRIGAELWVAGTDPDTGVGTTKAASNSNRGTKKQPYATIKQAALQVWDDAETKTKDFTINVSGKLISSTAQYISDDITNARSILVKGTRGSSYDVIDRGLSSATSGSSTGSAINITTKSVIVTLENLKITGAYSTSSGGGIYIYANDGGAKVNLGDGLVVQGNRATYGAGVYVSSGCSLCLYGTATIGNSDANAPSSADTAITYINKSTTAYGGGIYNSGGFVYLGAKYKENGALDSTNYSLTKGVYANVATTDGGGIYNHSSGVLYIYSGNVSYNYAGNDGGGVHSAGTFAMTGGTVGYSGTKTSPASGTSSSNYAEGKGGGLFLSPASGKSASLTSGALVKYNYAKTYGGGIHVDSGVGTVSIANEISFNGAKYGAGLSVSKASTGPTLSSNFNKNQASQSGGAVYIESGKDLKITGGTYTSNVAGIGGGAIYQAGTLEISGGTFGESGKLNTASNGGAMYCNNSNGFDIKNGASFYAGSAGSNDVFLYSGSVNITAAWTGSLTMSPDSPYSNTKQYVKGSKLEDHYASVSVVPQVANGITTKWMTTSGGYIEKGVRVSATDAVTELETLASGSKLVVTGSITADQVAAIATAMNTRFTSDSDARFALDLSATSNLNSISDNGFKNCKALTSIALPTTVNSLGKYAFNGCNNLKTITGLNGVSSIGPYAFNSTALESFDFSKTAIAGDLSSTENLFENMFWYTPITSITIPSTITKLPNNLLSMCQKLETVTFENPSSINELPSGTFSGCTKLASITYPSGLKKIGGNVFAQTSFITFTVPYGVEEIEDQAFFTTASLTEIYIPVTVKKIGAIVFGGSSTRKVVVKYKGTEAQWNEIEKDSKWSWRTLQDNQSMVSSVTYEN